VGIDELEEAVRSRLGEAGKGKWTLLSFEAVEVGFGIQKAR
jgi:hypothetical protein